MCTAAKAIVLGIYEYCRLSVIQNVDGARWRVREEGRTGKAEEKSCGQPRQRGSDELFNAGGAMPSAPAVSKANWLDGQGRVFKWWLSL